MSPPRLRHAVRALVVDDDGRFLMVRLVYPHGVWWVLPGGGVDDGEDEMSALRRELAEETGLTGFEIGPIVWRRVHEFDLVDTSGVRWDGQRETVHIVNSAHFEPSPQMSETQLRAEHLDTMRWWTCDDVDTYTGSDHFAPHDIAVHVRSVIDNGPPAVPPDLFHKN